MSTLDAHQSPLSCPPICHCVLFLYLLSERAFCLSLSFLFLLADHDHYTLSVFCFSSQYATFYLSSCFFGALLNDLSLHISKDLERCAGPQGHGRHWYRLEHSNLLGRPLSAGFLRSFDECIGVESLFGPKADVTLVEDAMDAN